MLVKKGPFVAQLITLGMQLSQRFIDSLIEAASHDIRAFLKIFLKPLL